MKGNKPVNPTQRGIRMLDLVIAMVSIFVAAPVFLAAAQILAVTYPHRIFFVQRRVGRHEELFGLIKFVTMVPGAEHMPGGSITHTRDPRISRVGRTLRRTKINELPQLWNVLRGHMSIVGPRPVTQAGHMKYGESGRRKLSQMAPGITGIGSIMLFNEEELISAIPGDPHQYHDEVIKPYKVELEHWFFRHQSIGLYLQVIVCTLLTLLHGRPTVRPSWRDLPLAPQRLRNNPAFVQHS